MSKINTFLQKRKMHENRHGIIMVITAYVLSFLMLVLGSDAFYNINSKAAGLNSESDEATHDLKENEILQPKLAGFQTEGLKNDFINPYNLPDSSTSSGKTTSTDITEPAVELSGDTVWLLGQAMDVTEYNNLLTKMGEYKPVAADGKIARKTGKGSIESFSETPKSMTTFKNISQDEVVMLERIVEAEASGEDMIGRILIVNVIFNRIHDKAFPDTVKDVIFQQDDGDYQFSPVSDKRFWSVKISDKTKEAVKRALQGEDYSDGALYFMARKRSASSSAKWFDYNLDWLFKHGGHEFYK